MTCRSLRVITLLVAAGVLGGVPACREKKEEPKVVTVTDGRVKKVTPKEDGTGEIVVTYKSEKAGAEVENKAIVNAATQITINGEPGKLADVAVGERVSGEVRVEKAGKVTQLIALKINVERAK